MKKILLILSLMVGLMQNVNAEDLLARIDGNYTTMSLKDNILYIGKTTGMLQLFDISEPTTPKVIGEVNINTGTSDIKIQANYAYTVSGTEHVLKTINVSNPNTPVLVNTYETEYLDPQNVEESNSSDGIYILGPIGSNAVEIKDEYAYVADMDHGLQIIDISNPSSPQHVVTWSLNDFAEDVAVDGDYAYVTGIATGLHIIDISNPNVPVKIMDYNNLEYPYKVDVIDSYAYVSDRNGINIIDISNPSSPVLKSTYQTGDYVVSIDVDGTTIYLAELNSGVEVLDIHDVSLPKLIKQYSVPNSAIDVTLVKDSLYVVENNYMEGGTGSILIFNTSIDTDNDGIANVDDQDDDNDGISDYYEILLGTDRLDANSTPLDTDKDGIPNAYDPDDDNDGISDTDEATLGFNPLNATDGLADYDGDGFSNAQEFDIGTDMNDATDKPQWMPILMGDIMIFVPVKVQ